MSTRYPDTFSPGEVEDHWGSPSAEWGLLHKQRMRNNARLWFKPVAGGQYRLMRRIRSKWVRALNETHPPDDIPPREVPMSSDLARRSTLAEVLVFIAGRSLTADRIEGCQRLASHLEKQRSGYEVRGPTLQEMARALGVERKFIRICIKLLCSMRLLWQSTYHPSRGYRYELAWGSPR